MFGSIGFPELVMIFIVVLLVFGPKKLPEFAKLLGKTVREFRATVDEAKAAIENEIYKEGPGQPLSGIGKEIQDALDIRGTVEKSLRDIGKDVSDAVNAVNAPADARKQAPQPVPAAEQEQAPSRTGGAKKKIDEKSE